MFTEHVPPDTLRGKSTQWLALTRAAATAIVHDRLIEPWFAAFAGTHPRCEFWRDGARALDGAVAMLTEGAAPAYGCRAALAQQLQERGYLPVPFDFGAAPYAPAALLRCCSVAFRHVPACRLPPASGCKRAANVLPLFGSSGTGRVGQVRYVLRALFLVRVWA